MNLLDEEKLFYERFYALHRDPLLLSVFSHFGIGVFRRSSVLENFEIILGKTNFSGKRCVEIGTCNGLTALVLSRHFDEVVSIDIVPNDLKHEIAKFCGIQNVRFLDCKDNADKAAIINGMSFDAAYVDGDHIRDTESDFGLVRRCGRVLFHEYWPAQPVVWNLVSELKASGTVITSGKFALWTA